MIGSVTSREGRGRGEASGRAVEGSPGPLELGPSDSAMAAQTSPGSRARGAAAAGGPGEAATCVGAACGTCSTGTDMAARHHDDTEDCRPCEDVAQVDRALHPYRGRKQTTLPGG